MQKAIDIYNYLSEDIIKKYMETQQKTTSSELRKEEKLDQFKYRTDLDSGKVEIRRSKTTRNFIEPNIDSSFHRALDHLCDKAIREGEGYRRASRKLTSIRDLKIDENISLSFTVFAHVYGSLDKKKYERQFMPLDGWSLVAKHGKGHIKKKLKAVKISYSQMSNFIDSKQDLGGEKSS